MANNVHVLPHTLNRITTCLIKLQTVIVIFFRIESKLSKGKNDEKTLSYLDETDTVI